MNVKEAILEYKIIAIVRGFEPEECEALSKALYAGGIRLVEVTFPQEDLRGMEKTKESIQRIKETLNGKVFPGAGTVMTTEQVDAAEAAGAEYIISPNMDKEIIRYTKEKGLVSIPGVMTPTEIAEAYRAGADFAKVFPAGVLGADYMCALQGPLGHIPMLAVGGISNSNIGKYLKAGAKGVGVGGLLTKRELVTQGNFEEITRLAREYVKHAG